MRISLWTAAATVAVATLTTSPLAVIRTVDDDPGADFTSIQAAILASNNGDVVQVFCGTYLENITMKDGVDVVGESPSCTIIDGGANASVVRFIGGATPTRLEGFTIRNGRDLIGGGILVSAAQAVISRNIVTGNAAIQGGGGTYGFGGGIAVYDTGGVISENLIHGNTAETAGGGLDVYLGYPTIVNNTIVENIALDPVGTAYGGGAYIKSSDPTVSSNIIFGNSSEAGGGGIDLINSSLAYLLYTNLDQNLPTNIDADISGYMSGPGNLFIDPLLVGSSGSNYCPRSNSPAIDAGPTTPPASSVDFFGRSRVQDGDFDGTATVDMGFCETDEVTRLTIDGGGNLGWDASVNPSAVFHLYRGLLTALRSSCAVDCIYTQDPLVVPEARQECSLLSPTFTDLDDPPASDGYLYLVSGEDLVESGLGPRSDGLPRDNDHPCP